MNRTKWEFPYPANKLLAAATTKYSHHSERKIWWDVKKDEVLAKIKAEGIEIDDSLSPENSKMSNYYRNTTVGIREDLQKDLEECVAKIKEHNNKAEGYDAWIQVLGSQGATMFSLYQEDWLYFFGK